MFITALAMGWTGVSMVLMSNRHAEASAQEEWEQNPLRNEAPPAVRDREGPMDLLGESLPARFFYLDRHRRYRAPNDAFAAWFGLPKEAVAGLHVSELVGESAWTLIRPWLDRAYAGEAVDYEMELPYRHGGTRWIHATYTPHRNQQGEVIGLLVVVSNMTRQKRAEEELRFNQDRYRYIFETVGVSIFEEDWSGVRDILVELRATGVTDLRGYLSGHPEIVSKAVEQVRIKDVNEYSVQLFKATSKADLLGALDRIFLPETIEVFVEELVALWENRDIYQAQAPLRTLEGKELSVLFTLVAPKREADWQRIMVTLTDVTALREAEAMVRESEQHLRTALGAGRMSAWAIDLTTDTVSWDAMHAAIFGAAREDVPPGLNGLCSLIHPDDRERVRRSLAASAIQGHFAEEFRITDPNGGLRWISGQGTLVRDHEGRPARLVGVHTDITDRKEAQVCLENFAHELEREVVSRTAALRQSQDQLRALATELTLTEQRERQQFASQLHDHLQQLLVVCKLKLNYAKGLMDGIPSGPALLKELDGAVSNALAYSRSLVAELSPPVLHQHGIMAAIKWLAHWMKENMNLTVIVETQQNSIPLPEAHNILLFQSVRELLINAAKYAGTGRATVRLHVAETDLVIHVQDEGTGFDIATATLSGDSSKNVSSKFGLFSIRERMTALGGSLEIRSALGQGTEATLKLPLAVLPSSQPNLQDRAGEQRPNFQEVPPDRFRERRQAHVRVVLVDDHAMVRRGLRNLLENYPDVAIVGEAEDGEEAVVAADQLMPDVIIMDVNMPGMNGLEATRRIKQRHASTVVIGLSVNADRESLNAMRRAGAVALLTKGAEVSDIYRAMKNALHESISSTPE
ncbi:MAG TPA: PAS domain S-box protein [Nitrospira sp.]|nr:PAS domain S-box protein [Nitrospira sp.]